MSAARNKDLMRSEIEDLREDEESFEKILAILEARRSAREKHPPITEEEMRMLDEAEEDIKAGRVLTTAQIRQNISNRLKD